MALPGTLTPAQLQRIRILILDVDGVLSDGRIIYSASGEELKCFDCTDGSGITYWRRAGHKVAIVTGRSCAAVDIRARELEIDMVLQGQKYKEPAVAEVLARFHATPGEAAYVGDDLIDIPAMRAAGCGIAVANATPETREYANAVTDKPGGRGAVREVIEYILKAQGRWAGILERYLPKS